MITSLASKEQKNKSINLKNINSNNNKLDNLLNRELNLFNSGPKFVREILTKGDNPYSVESKPTPVKQNNNLLIDVEPMVSKKETNKRDEYINMFNEFGKYIKNPEIKSLIQLVVDDLTQDEQLIDINQINNKKERIILQPVISDGDNCPILIQYNKQSMSGLIGILNNNNNIDDKLDTKIPVLLARRKGFVYICNQDGKVINYHDIYKLLGSDNITTLYLDIISNDE